MERQCAGWLTARERRQAPGARPIPQRLSHATIITGFDRHSVRSATSKIAYVAASRGREDIEAFVESMADLSQVQNRTGDRKAAVEVAFEPAQNDWRAEVKRLFRHLQRVRAAKETVEHTRTVDLCRQAAETLGPANLQEHAI